MRILIVILFFSLAVSCQSIEEGWRNIKPLQTNRSAVEKLLGTSRPLEPRYSIYDRDNAFLRVTYTTTPCAADSFGRGDYNVPKDTVISYYLSIKKLIKLDDFTFERGKYTRGPSGDVENLVDYKNPDDGITITAYVQQNVEYVNSIRIGPSRKDAEKFKCPEKRK